MLPPLRSAGQYGEITFVPFYAIACKQSVSDKSKEYGLKRLLTKCLDQDEEHDDQNCKYSMN